MLVATNDIELLAPIPLLMEPCQMHVYKVDRIASLKGSWVGDLSFITSCTVADVTVKNLKCTCYSIHDGLVLPFRDVIVQRFECVDCV